MKTLAALLLGAALTLGAGCNIPPKGRDNTEKLSTGYANGKTSIGDLHVVPVYYAIGIDLNPLLHLDHSLGNIQLIGEPFLNIATHPKLDIQSGIRVGLNYSYSIAETFTPYIEATAGPSYLGIDVPDQGKGFAFSIRTGAGLEFSLSENTALRIGCDYEHTSHGNTRSVKNRGLDTLGGTFGFSIQH